MLSGKAMIIRLIASFDKSVIIIQNELLSRTR